MKRAIVTGANGFIGSAVVKELVKRGIEVFALVRKGHINNLPNSKLITIVPFELNNIQSLRTILEDKEIDTFFHFAWEGSAGEGRGDTLLQLQNAYWTVDCLKFAKVIGCNRFIGSGSVTEKETIKVIYSEGCKPALGYIYGGGKVAAHAMCKAVAVDIKIDFIWAMITNAYGVGEKSPRMINSTIQKSICGEEPHFTAATQNYDFVYIDDVARAFAMIAEKGRPFGEYLIGSSQAKPLKDFLMELKEEVAPNIEFHFGTIPFSGIGLSLEDFNCDNTEEDTGFKAMVSFREGCRKTKEWWESNCSERKHENA